MRMRLVIIFYCFAMILIAEDIKLPDHTIEIQGNTVHDESELYDVLNVQTASFWQFWKDDTPKIYDKLLPTMKQSLKNFYDSEGFYDAEFATKVTETTVYLDIKEL